LSFETLPRPGARLGCRLPVAGKSFGAGLRARPDQPLAATLIFPPRR